MSEKTELEQLKEMLDMEGIIYAKNAGIKKLKSLLDEHRANKTLEDDSESTEEAAEVVEKPKPVKKTKPKYDNRTIAKINELYPDDNISDPIKRATRLIRLEVVNMDPDTVDVKSTLVQIVTVKYGELCNRVIPYNTVTHVEYVGALHLIGKTYVAKETFKDDRNIDKIKTVIRPKYSVNILDPISTEELEDIRLRQVDTLKD